MVSDLLVASSHIIVGVDVYFSARGSNLNCLLVIFNRFRKLRGLEVVVAHCFELFVFRHLLAVQFLLFFCPCFSVVTYFQQIGVVCNNFQTFLYSRKRPSSLQTFVAQLLSGNNLCSSLVCTLNAQFSIFNGSIIVSFAVLHAARFE